MISNLFLAAEGEQNNQYIWIFVALLVVLVVVLLVVPMFTNKKRAKETNELHNSLKPGDVVKTVGGIIGTIKEVRQVSPADKEMVIETGVGDNKTTMVFDIAALYQVVTRAEVPVEQTAAPAEDADAATEAIATPVAEETAEQPESADTAATADTPVEAAEETAATEAPAEEKAEAEESEETKTVAEEPAEEKEAKPAKKSGGKKSTKK